MSIGIIRLSGVIDDLQGEDACRSTIAGDVSRIQGELNAAGWTAAITKFQGGSDEQIAEQARIIAELVEQLEPAQERRDRVNEICT